MVELPKKNNKKDKKKRFWSQKQEYIKEWKEQTLAIIVSISNAL